MKLWGGRFSGKTDKLMDDFNSSISFDQRLYRQDIQGSIAHVKMLGRCGIISQEDAHLIERTLNEILDDIENDKLLIDQSAEDIHSFVEAELISRIGDVGKKLHTGRSRNDQVALDTRMYLMQESENIKNLLLEYGKCLIEIAENNINTIMPGYTHLQIAQPVTLGYHIMAYFEMFVRDFNRICDCQKRINVMPLGSGALAGTTYSIDRNFVASELGFSSITNNCMDSVSDRDYIIELASCISIIMMHLSRFSEEIILWSSSEFSFIELDDKFSTGSSIMPQKKNPDVAELVRGKTGRTYGNLITLLTIMKALPMAYNKDMQEDKEAIFDSIDTVKICIPVFVEMLKTMKINKDIMYKAASQGFSNATDVADYLVQKGIAFRDAHEITGKIVSHCIKKSVQIQDMSLEELKSFSNKIENDIYEKISLENCVINRNVPGGPSPIRVIEAIEAGKQFLTKYKSHSSRIDG